MPPFWKKLRADFPVTKNCIYLDHASCGPMPNPVRRKISEYCDELAKRGDRAWPRWLARREEIRVAPHFYNTREELETFLEKLVKYTKEVRA